MIDHELSGPIAPPIGAMTGATMPDGDLMRRFARDYLALLDERAALITHHLDLRQYESANIVLLSLQTSSVMAGMDSVAEAALQLRRAIDPAKRSVVDLSGVECQIGRSLSALLAELPAAKQQLQRRIDDPGPFER